jgi:hypothetical protein
VAVDKPGGEGNPLSELISRRLADGSLPYFCGQRTFGGRGDGGTCGCCGRPIGPADIQYDVDQPQAPDRASDPAQSIPMHLHCFRLWVQICAPPASIP